MLRPLRSRDSGFSLVEIMVALVVFGIVMMAALPNLQDANKTHQVRTAASQIETTLRRARASAVKTRTNVRVTLNAGSRNCTVQRDSDDNGSFDTTVISFELDDNVTLAEIGLGGGTSVTFDERGAPDNPGNIVVRATNGIGRELIIAAGSGSIMVQPAADLGTGN